METKAGANRALLELPPVAIPEVHPVEIKIKVGETKEALSLNTPLCPTKALLETRVVKAGVSRALLAALAATLVEAGTKGGVSREGEEAEVTTPAVLVRKGKGGASSEVAQTRIKPN